MTMTKAQTLRISVRRAPAQSPPTLRQTQMARNGAEGRDGAAAADVHDADGANGVCVGDGARLMRTARA
jgi:hypothetical protein